LACVYWELAKMIPPAKSKKGRKPTKTIGEQASIFTVNQGIF